MDVTVIIPSYKPGKYIEDCLMSLGEQTLSPYSFEIIIVLNGCDEPWRSMINNLIGKYLSNHNAKVLQTLSPGVSNARNMALDVAKGKYITFIDDDDYVSPKYLEELLRVSSPDWVGLSDAIYFDDESGKLDYNNNHHKIFTRLKDSLSPSIYQARKFFNGPCMKLVHRDIIGDRRFDIRFANSEDALFMALISNRIHGCQFCTTNAVYYRRIRNDSATTTKKGTKYLITNSFRFIFEICRIYARSPHSYNLLFTLSRVIAPLKSSLKTILKA